MDRPFALARVESWAKENVEPDERERFREVAESELLGLHEGNFARYPVTRSEFQAWQKAWTVTA
jgi:hypothetical protein